MSIGSIDIDKVLASVKKSLKEDKTISSGLRASIEMMILLIGLLVNRLGLNSKNSSKSSLQDPNRVKKIKEKIQMGKSKEDKSDE